MRKILLTVCIIALVVLLLSAVSGKFSAPAEGAPQITSVSEAAFSMRSGGSEDATRRLVGSFTDGSGVKYNFNGYGGVKRIAQNLSGTNGSYSLLQSPDGAAILDMSIDGQQAIYSFAVTSAEGQFTLTDAKGVARIFTPVE